MATLRDYPYGNAQFLVEIDGIAEAAFEQVLLPELAIAVVEFRDGGDAERAARKLPGPASYSNLVLKRGFAGSLTLYQWWQQTMQGEGDARRNVAVILLNEERSEVARWRLTNAFPARYTFSPLDALDGSELVECLELAFDALRME
jgi:phage tail-like protein